MPLDLSGDRYGRLRVLSLKSTGPRTWLCQCDCGETCVVLGSHLRSGHTCSCGCLAREPGTSNRLKHGHKTGAGRSPEYSSWRNMIARCTNPKNNRFRYYGARGIGVCTRWLLFVNFLADMGSRPPGTSLDRYPNRHGNYEPGNCRWATPHEQEQNKDPFRRAATKITADIAASIRSSRESARALGRRFGISHTQVRDIKIGKAWRTSATA